MAVALTETRQVFAGTGAAASYPTDIYAQTADQIEVYEAGVLQTVDVDFTLTNLNDNDGVQVDGTFANGAEVVVQRVTAIEQGEEILNNETVLQEVIERGLDHQTLISQEIDAKVQRAILAPEGEEGIDIEGVADTVMGFDDLGAYIERTAADLAEFLDDYLPGPQGEPAATPNFTASAGAPGTGVVLSGVYPNLNIQVATGPAGASGAGSGDVIAANNLADLTNIPTARTNLGLAIGVNVQPFDADLATIAANITAAGHALLDDADAAAQRTTLGLGNVNNTSDANKPVSTAQQTALDAKAPLTPREQLLASSATITPTFLNDVVTVTALAVAAQLANPTGTEVVNHGIVVRIKDNGTARALTYDTQYRAVGVTLPTTTVLGKWLYLGMIWNTTDDKWDVVSVAQQA